MGLQHFILPFSFLGVGLVLSTVVFIIELSIKHIGKNRGAAVDVDVAADDVIAADAVDFDVEAVDVVAVDDVVDVDVVNVDVVAVDVVDVVDIDVDDVDVSGGKGVQICPTIK